MIGGLPTDLSVLVIFGLTYAGMATGRIPGLRTDRAGIALAAAILILIVTGKSPAEAVAWVDLPTLALLFGLMVLSGKFSLSGFYDYCAFRISHAAGSPERLLAVTIVVAGALSAVLANDIIAFAIPPLLCLGLRARGLNPVPYLIGLAAATNVGSAATVIGNPQNILIGQVGGLDFWRFIALCGVPSLLGLGVVYGVIVWQWRHRWALPRRPEFGAGPAASCPAPGTAGQGRGADGGAADRIRRRAAARHLRPHRGRRRLRQPLDREFRRWCGRSTGAC